MNRSHLFLSLCLILITMLAGSPAAACDSCEVERSCEVTDTGMRCTIKAKGETTVESVRECVRAMAEKHHAMEGVSVTFEEIEGGIVVVRSSNDPEVVKAMHAKHEACAKDGKGCCCKGKHGHHGHHAHHDCTDAEKKAHVGCPHAKS